MELRNCLRIIISCVRGFSQFLWKCALGAACYIPQDQFIFQMRMPTKWEFVEFPQFTCVPFEILQTIQLREGNFSLKEITCIGKFWSVWRHSIKWCITNILNHPIRWSIKFPPIVAQSTWGSIDSVLCSILLMISIQQKKFMAHLLIFLPKLVDIYFHRQFSPERMCINWRFFFRDEYNLWQHAKYFIVDDFLETK